MMSVLKKYKLASFCTILIVTCIIVPWLILMFCAYVIATNPPKPEITYSEFPLRLVYEFNGNIFEINDTYVCEFDGFDFTTATGEKYRKWRGYLKSGDTRITLGEIGEFEFYCFSTADYGDILAGRYMDDPDYEGETYENNLSIFYTNNFEDSAVSKMLSDDEAWEKYKIRVISWECAPPIENSY